VNRPAWPFLSDEEWAQIDHHVTTCDYPETSATWVALGREAGFADAREIFCDPTGFYRIYRYECRRGISRRRLGARVGRAYIMLKPRRLPSGLLRPASLHGRQ